MPKEPNKHDEPTKIPLDFGPAVEGLMGVKWEKTKGERQSMDELTAAEMAKEVYGELKALRAEFDDCEVLGPILWELEQPDLAAPPTGPGGSANVRVKRLPAQNETDKWLRLKYCIQKLRAIHKALMDAEEIGRASPFMKDADRLETALNQASQ